MNELVEKKTFKVVINKCYGGFGLSEKAVKLGRMLANDATWGGFTLSGEKFSDGKVWEGIFGTDPAGGWELKRHDPILVRVVEQLKGKAGSRFAKLEVVELSSNQYRVGEYDGMEWIEEPESMDWITI